jgi:hypothetical protein
VLKPPLHIRLSIRQTVNEVVLVLDSQGSRVLGIPLRLAVVGADVERGSLASVC